MVDTKSNDDSIAVSIICNCYNHEKYIRQALESFLMQKTSFRFEILIHDDASTDESQTIIREYENKYPQIVKPIYQKDNQYSQKISVFKKFQIPRARGKYIAFCEGDDYWIDKYKLQKQYDALEKHQTIGICACKTKMVLNEITKGYIAPSGQNTILTPEQVILGGGGYVGTASLMFRKELFSNGSLFEKLMALDYFYQIVGSIPNGMLYLNDCMCVYRLTTEGSWSVRIKSNASDMITHLEKVNKNLMILDIDTNNKYHESIQRHILENEMSAIVIKKEYSDLHQKRYRHIWDNMPFKKKIKIRFSELMHIMRLDK